MKDYKIGDLVVFMDKEYSKRWKKSYGVSLYGKLAKIIGIYDLASILYLLEFKENIGSEQYGDGRGRYGHCYWSKKDEFKLAINHLKFKKWIKKT